LAVIATAFGSHVKLPAAAAVFFFSGDRRLDLPAKRARREALHHACRAYD